jgi:NitT/TauT family transport system ATP-binding protein
MGTLIDVRGVSFSYPTGADQTEVLRDFSVEIRDGECFCLLGPSGCGKTTALRLIAGFDHPVAGTATIEGHPISGPGADRGVVFQGDDSLFHWLNAASNVAFGLRLRNVPRRERTRVAEEYLDLVGLRGQGTKYPTDLSGGIKQRIQIARVLANNPKVLLMDEPFAALDAQTRAELQDELVRIWMETNKTILFITHDIGEALLLGDRVGVMRAGPASAIRETIEIDLPRPRDRASIEFARLYGEVQALITDEVKRSRANVDD